MPITKNELKSIKSLLTKKGRKSQRKFLAEGVRLLEESLNFHVLPEIILYNKALIDIRGEQLIQNLKKKNVTVTSITKKEVESLSDTKSPQGIVGVFKIREQKADEPSLKNIRKILWCDTISDPGNVGTLLRSALAFDFSTVMVSGDTADPFSPKVVRASMGAIFKMRIIRDDIKAMVELLNKNRFKLIAADINGKPAATIVPKVENKRFALAVGSEAFGLSLEILNEAALKIRIKHELSVESLNAAVAGSILMNEFYKMR